MDVYFEVLSDISGLPVQDEYSLFQILKELCRDAGRI